MAKSQETREEGRWEVRDRRAALAGGADPQRDLLLLSVTAGDVIQRFNNYHELEGEENPMGAFGKLTPEEQREMLHRAELTMCGLDLQGIDEALDTVFRHYL